MSDPGLLRADDVLARLVDLVETARAIPVTGSCLVPREHVLDLLDELREALPPDVAEARRVVAERDALLTAARAAAQTITAEAGGTAGRRLAEADRDANGLLAQARVRAAGLVEAAQTEHARLVSATGIHQAATAGAETMRSDADRYARATRAEAEQQRADAEHYADELRAHADDYADATLGDIVDTLQRAAGTAERGRAELSARRVRAAGSPDAATDADPATTAVTTPTAATERRGDPPDGGVGPGLG